MNIPPRLLQALITRGVILWLFGKLAALVNLAMAQLRPGPFFPFWCVAIAAGLCFVDLLRRKETMLLGNLGIRTSTAVMVATVPGAVLETAMAFIR